MKHSERRTVETSLKSGVVVTHTEGDRGLWRNTYTSRDGRPMTFEEIEERYGFEPHPDDVEAHRKRVKAGKAHSADGLVKMREERKAKQEKEKEQEKAEKQEKPKAEKAKKAEKPKKPSTLPDSGPKP